MTKLTDNKLEEYWKKLGDIPVDENDEIMEVFVLNGYVYPKGTDKYCIWQYFDIHHSKGVYFLMHGKVE